VRRADAARDQSVERAARLFNRASTLRFVAACAQIGERASVFHFRLVDGESRDAVLLAVHTDCAVRPLVASPDRMRAAASLLSKLRLTGLLPCDKASWAPDRDALFLVAPLVPSGSLRDVLRRVDPLASISAKRNAVGQPLPSNAVPLLFDLLSTMRLLARIGVPLHHVHAGNVLLNADGRPPLLDISSALLGEPPRCADLMRRVGRGSEHAQQRGAAVDAAVVAFATVVYELFSGDELESIQQIRAAILPAWVRAMLALVFEPTHEPPTLATLSDYVAQHGTPKARTYRDKTPPLDAHEVEFLARARRAAEAWLRDSSSGDSSSSAAASSSGGAALTTAQQSRPRSQRKKKKKQFGGDS